MLVIPLITTYPFERRRLKIFRALRVLAAPARQATEHVRHAEHVRRLNPPGAPGLSIAEMQRRKEAGSTILSHPG